MDALKLISESSMKENVPQFNVGDTIKVHVRIKEGDKSRIQVFEGTVIAKKQEQLATLADYKKSVIYEYVTGKKEVPDEF